MSLNDNKFGLVSNRSQPYDPISPSQFSGGLDRDAEAEGRTDHPLDEGWTFSATVTNNDDIQLGIEDTEPPDMPIHVPLNPVQRTTFDVHNENSHINEDAKLYNNNDHDTIPNIQNGIVQAARDEADAPQVVVDNPTCNIHPVHSIECQDGVNSSDSSDDEDPIVGSESGFDGDDEEDSSDDHKRTGESSLSVPNLPNLVHMNEQSIQINLVRGFPTASVTSPNEVLEIEANVTVPVEGARQIIRPPTRSRAKLILKLSYRVRLNDDYSEESTA